VGLRADLRLTLLAGLFRLPIVAAHDTLNTDSAMMFLSFCLSLWVHLGAVAGRSVASEEVLWILHVRTVVTCTDEGIAGREAGRRLARSPV
jgi:hypothetical protein